MFYNFKPDMNKHTPHNLIKNYKANYLVFSILHVNSLRNLIPS